MVFFIKKQFGITRLEHIHIAVKLNEQAICSIFPGNKSICQDNKIFLPDYQENKNPFR